MNVARYCKPKSINWDALSELGARLSKHGMHLESSRVEIVSYPDRCTFDSIEEAVSVAKREGPPVHWSVRLSCRSEAGKVTFTVRRFRTVLDGTECLVLDADDIRDTIALDSIMNFLGLERAEAMQKASGRKRSTFIAHRFDQMGTSYADRLSRYLQLLKFSVTTGRAFSGQSVAAKVSQRIKDQGLLITILTPGDDNSWLQQESAFALACDIPVFLLKQAGMPFGSGLFGDMEYILFASEHIEATFIPILEGLSALGYEFAAT